MSASLGYSGYCTYSILLDLTKVKNGSLKTLHVYTVDAMELQCFCIPGTVGKNGFNVLFATLHKGNESICVILSFMILVYFKISKKCILCNIHVDKYFTCMIICLFVY